MFEQRVGELSGRGFEDFLRSDFAAFEKRNEKFDNLKKKIYRLVLILREINSLLFEISYDFACSLLKCKSNFKVP